MSKRTLKRSRQRLCCKKKQIIIRHIRLNSQLSINFNKLMRDINRSFDDSVAKLAMLCRSLNG